MWVTDHGTEMKNLGHGDSIYVYIRENPLRKNLQDGGYLEEEDFKNPMTDKAYEEDTAVKITKNGNKYTYEVNYSAADKGCD